MNITINSKALGTSKQVNKSKVYNCPVTSLPLPRPKPQPNLE
jgi:hypothetical protein